VEVLASLVLIAGWSYKTTFNKELLISSLTLYSTKPNLRNLFMKKRLVVRIVESLVNRSPAIFRDLSFVCLIQTGFC
jgi:hypothetical protein